MTSKGTRGLTKVQKKLLNRIRLGHWYLVQHPPTANMQVLLDRGLVGTGGRVEVIKAAYVPQGWKPARPEQFPKHTCVHPEPNRIDELSVETDDRIETWKQCTLCFGRWDFDTKFKPKSTPFTRFGVKL